MSLDVSALSLEEVLTIAIRLEEEGIEFYKAASEKAHSKPLREALDHLIVQEVEHRLIFQGIARDFGMEWTPKRSASVISPRITQALVEAAVFPLPEERNSAIASLHSPAQVLRFAIQVEKGSVLFYDLAAKAARSENVRDAFTKVLAEERKHVRFLAAQLKVHKAGSKL